MKKLDKMTAAQEALVPKYVEKWTKIGHRTQSIDKDKTIAAIKTLYKTAKLKEPVHYFFFDSPLQCQIAVALMKDTNFQKILKVDFENNLGNNLWNNLSNNLWNNLSNNLSNNLWNNLGNNLWNNLGNNLWNNLSNNLGNNLWNNLSNNLWNNLSNNLGNNLENNLRNNLSNNLQNNLENNLYNNLSNNLHDNLGNNLSNNLENNLWNNLWNNLSDIKISYESVFYSYYYQYWMGYYEFVLLELFPEQKEKFSYYLECKEAIKEIHSFIAFENIVFISDFPVSITLDSSNRLHHETEPSMMFNDGHSLFNLNGITVPKWIIETPKHEIPAKKVLELTNTEQRAVVMRHVGLAYFLEHLGAKEIDSYKDYKLYYLTISNEQIGPYLFMTCPSSGRQFLEGCGDPVGDNTIDAKIKTCQDALEWRAKKASKDLMTKFNLKWSMHA